MNSEMIMDYTSQQFINYFIQKYCRIYNLFCLRSYQSPDALLYTSYSLLTANKPFLRKKINYRFSIYCIHIYQNRKKYMFIHYCPNELYKETMKALPDICLETFLDLSISIFIKISTMQNQALRERIFTFSSTLGQ